MYETVGETRIEFHLVFKCSFALCRPESATSSGRSLSTMATCVSFQTASLFKRKPSCKVGFRKVSKGLLSFPLFSEGPLTHCRLESAVSTRSLLNSTISTCLIKPCYPSNVKPHAMLFPNRPWDYFCFHFQRSAPHSLQTDKRRFDRVLSSTMATCACFQTSLSV
jgi:hypothetical protein